MDPQLIEFMMQLLQQPPDAPAGRQATSTPPTAVPQNLRQPTETEELMNMLLSQLQAPQAGAHAMNASHGMRGAAAGRFGGRPTGS